MSENILQDLETKKIRQKEFDDYKNAGYLLLQNKEIEEKEYYSKVRNKGIQLGLIAPNEYPGRLPKWAEGAIEVVGGTTGAVLGFRAGGTKGASLGAGTGAASGSLFADWLGDLIAPNMPAPSAEERLKDAAITGVVDAGITAAVPVAGKALSETVKKIIKPIQKEKEKLKSFGPQGKEQLNFLEKSIGITDDALEQAKILSKENVPLSLGQASSSPFTRALFTFTSRTPIGGAPGQKALAKTFEAVDNALNKKIMATARAKKLTEVERSELIKKYGADTFKNWEQSYKSVYKRAESEMKKQGNFFNTASLARVAERNLPKSVFENMPPEVKKVLYQIGTYKDVFVGQPLSKGGSIEMKKLFMGNKMTFQDIKALDFRLKDLIKKYDPAKSATPNNTAFRTIKALQEELKTQLRNPKTNYGRLLLEGDNMFKEYMSFLEGPTGKEFQKALGRGALRPGVGRIPTKKLEDLYKNAFGEAKSPQKIQELRKLIGPDRVNVLAANYLDDLFVKYIKSDKRNFNKLFNELGFDNKQGIKYAATKELLKDYKATNVDDLFNFLNVLKEFPEMLPDVNTFILRSATLSAAQSLGPSALIGTTGIATGGGIGAFAGFGFIRLLNSFLSQPFRKDLFKKAVEGGEEQKKTFVRKFLDSIPQLPDVPASAIAVQPAVPFVSEEIQK